MPRLSKRTIEKNFRIINDLYQNFSYEIAVYGTKDYSREGTKKLAREIRLELRKFI
jgi:hypothetical protein